MLPYDNRSVLGYSVSIVNGYSTEISDKAEDNLSQILRTFQYQCAYEITGIWNEYKIG
jgi:hypothetical protein